MIDWNTYTRRNYCIRLPLHFCIPIICLLNNENLKIHKALDSFLCLKILFHHNPQSALPACLNLLNPQQGTQPSYPPISLSCSFNLSPV